MNEKIYAKEEFEALTRDEMYGALRELDPVRAKGRSRAKKEELTDLYRDALEAKTATLLAVEDHGDGFFETSDPAAAAALVLGQPVAMIPHEHVVTEESKTCGHCGGPLTEPEGKPGWKGCVPCDWSAPVTFSPKSELAVAVEHNEPHVHGPGCNHDHELPKLAGVEELQRLNPEMPPMPLIDGGVLVPRTEEDHMFTFKDGVDRLLTEKETVVFERLKKSYAAFCENPANTPAKRAVLDDIYALKISGVIVNPKFTENVKKGRADLREARRAWDRGVTPAALKDAAKTAEAES